ncbi:farnesol dehydrogenase-like [Phlebotomus argentipes]|uniref:farnesol dehydrogenase-like n=1 Tax=Phlebotomus argentipes TaxID=94469 RepID=UPI00289316F2|nr:farnesol dehydrogenase-like [Phlebotomus argentipes]
MEQWKNRVAVVTGASAGIGAAIVKDLVKAGMITIGLARRLEKVQALKKDLPANLQGNLHAVKCDISKEDDIVRVFDWIVKKFNGIDVLINNAGVLRETELIKSDNSELIREVIDTNVFGLVFCTREAYKSMEQHGRNSHVVHINSVVGHNIIRNLQMPSSNIYAPSKFAVTAITEIHRQEFIRSKHHIKVTSVSPGAVKTEMVPDDYKEKFGDIPFLQAEDVSQSVLHVLGTPPHVQIHELTIKPFGESF